MIQYAAAVRLNELAVRIPKLLAGVEVCGRNYLEKGSGVLPAPPRLLCLLVVCW